MAKYLFMFGYETPNQARNNEEHGRNDEGSIALFVEAISETDADEWGKVVAQMFLNALYENEYQPPRIADYSNGIEKNPDARFDLSGITHTCTIQHGDIEQLKIAVDSWLSNSTT